MTRDMITKRDMLKLISFSLSVIIAAGLVAYDYIFAGSESNKVFTAMNTVITSTVISHNNQDVQNEINNEITSLEKSLLSRRVVTSEIGRVNSEKSASVSQDLADIIITCKEISKDTNGAFDISICPVSMLWDFGGENQRLPEETEIKSALENVDYKTIQVNGTNITIGENQLLDLGAVGKGYACDKLKNILDNYRVKSAVVAVGGSLILYGNKNYTIGIANPEDNSNAMAVIKLKDTFVSTSGDYEQYFEQDGKKYHHILDATTGYPADTYLSSVTVICDSGLMSDALSTACYLMGYNDSISLLEKYDAEAVFVYKDKSVKITDGLKDIFKIVNTDYTLENETD